MRNPKFLAISRHRVYYFRWPLPKALHPIHRPSTIKLSLRTRDPKRALFLARYLSHAAEEMMMSATTDGMSLGEVRAIMKTHFSALLAAQKERIAAHGRLSNLDIEALQNSSAIAQQDVATGAPLLPDEDAGQLLRFIGHYKLPVQMHTPASIMLARELKRAHRDYCEAVMAYDRSLDSYDFLREDQASLEAPTQKGMPLHELTESYSADKIRGGNWSKKTEGESAEHLALLHEILGPDVDVRTLTATDAKRVKDTVHDYPKNRNKNPRTRGLTLTEVMAVEGVDKLNIKTVKKYFQTYTGLFHWAKLNGHVDSNVFEGLTVARSKNQSKAKRDAFTVEQVGIMLDHLLDPDSRLVRNGFQKWGSLIGIYSGARLNEISQIHLSDIREKDGIWVFDLNDDDESKHLKNLASRRLVPIHRRLIELGLLEHVEEMRRTKAEKLFPDFTYDPKNGWGRKLGRWFNGTLLRELELKSDQLVFHSLRHTVVTHLSQAGVEQPIVQSIVGHAREGVTQQHYFKRGYKLSQLSEALHKLPY